ncbi:MAG: DUF389 domain-containing protein [Ilumatobacter sp.]
MSEGDTAGEREEQPDRRAGESTRPTTRYDPSAPSDELTDDDHFSDSAETPFRMVPIDLRLLTNPVVLMALGGLAVGIALLVWPARTDQALIRLVGIGLIWLALTGVRAAFTSNWRLDLIALLGPGVAFGVGVVIVMNPDRSALFAGRLLGIVALAYVARELVTLWRDSDRDRTRLPFLGVVAAIGVLLIALTGELFAMVFAVGAMILVALCVLVLVISLDGRTEGAANYRDTSEMVFQWLRDRPKSLEAREDLYAKILYEGPAARTRVLRFFALMGFASCIASMGVITDSTAVVIGAMLVAPLMTPLMGMAISLVMGWPNRLLRSASIAFGGIAFSIAIGILLGLVVPTDIDTAANAQILARATPTTLDLLTAIAAGGAGAYGLSRPDVSDSLPGVAIAISLVPPLSVVGIAYSQGDTTAGSGALLLFSTNMLAILIVGGITFVLTGVTPLDHAAHSGDRVRVGLGVTLTAAVIVLGGLLLNGAQLASDALRQDTIDEVIADWIPADSGYRVVRADLDGDDLVAVVIGPSEGLPDVADLADALSDEFDTTITVTVSLVVEETLTATGSR